MASKPIYTVTQVNTYIKSILDGDRNLSGVYIRGELSNYKKYPSGHHYFTLKDTGSALRCVLFRSSATRLRFQPESGMKVIAYGRITAFPRDGQYQLYVDALTPDGVGELYVAFEQLKNKLYQEGFFAAEHKKPIPRYPESIALITSQAGAAVHDMTRILNARWPMATVKLLPVRVQGAGAAAELTGALRYANRKQVADLIIIGRGGGQEEFQDFRQTCPYMRKDSRFFQSLYTDPGKLPHGVDNSFVLHTAYTISTLLQQLQQLLKISRTL